MREFIDGAYGYDLEIVGYEIEGTPSPEALSFVGRVSRPAGQEVVKPELARLRAATKARAEPDVDRIMQMQVLAEECAGWPPDVVRAALRGYAARETWFPSLAELRDQLQRHGRNRRMLAKAMSAVASLGCGR